MSDQLPILDMSALTAEDRNDLFDAAGAVFEVSENGVEPIGRVKLDPGDFQRFLVHKIQGSNKPGRYRVPDPEGWAKELDRREAEAAAINPKIVTRDAFDALPAADRMAHIRSGGQVVN